MSEGLSVIAEIKRQSPSAGVLATDVDVAELAKAYRAGGAVCLSVLTDQARFGGSAQDLEQARQATALPVLRKDFLSRAADIYQTKAMAADALLLIVADIQPLRLGPLHSLALDLGLDVVTEIRQPSELTAALAAGAYMIAVNQRSQPEAEHFSLDYDKALVISHLFKDLKDVITIAASGIGTANGTPIEAVLGAGYDAVLIGEALMTAPDPAAKLAALRRASSKTIKP